MPTLTTTVDQLHAPFRPRLARIVTLVMAIVVAVGTVVVLVAIPELARPTRSGS